MRLRKGELTLVVGICDRAEALLPRRVPDLQLRHVAFLVCRRLNGEHTEVYSNRHLVFLHGF